MWWCCGCWEGDNYRVCGLKICGIRCLLITPVTSTIFSLTGEGRERGGKEGEGGKERK